MRAHRGKRLLFPAYLVLFYFGWWARVLFPVERQISSELMEEALRVLVKVLFWILAPCLYLKWIDHRRVATFLKVSTHWRKGLLWSIGLVVLVGPVWLLCVTALHLKHMDTSHFSCRTIFEGVVVAALIEEVAMRGFIVNKLAESFSFGTANLLGALFFVAVHWQTWIFRQPLSAMALVQMSGSIFVLSIASGYLMKKLDSIWPSVTLHSIQNIIALLP